MSGTAWRIVIPAPGGPEVLAREDFTPSAPGAGELLVRNAAVGVNFLDTYYRSGLSYENQLPKSIDRDLSSMNQAEENFAMVFRRFPTSPYAEMAKAKYDEIRGRGAKKDMYVGKFYFKNGQYRAAIPRFLEILQEYPGLGYDEEALERTAIAFHKLGEKEKAQGAAQLMQEKFPNSKKTQKVLKKVGAASAPAAAPASN